MCDAATAPLNIECVFYTGVASLGNTATHSCGKFPAGHEIHSYARTNADTQIKLNSSGN